MTASELLHTFPNFSLWREPYDSPMTALWQPYDKIYTYIYMSHIKTGYIYAYIYAYIYILSYAVIGCLGVSCAVTGCHRLSQAVTGCRRLSWRAVVGLPCQWHVMSTMTADSAWQAHPCHRHVMTSSDSLWQPATACYSPWHPKAPYDSVWQNIYICEYIYYISSCDMWYIYMHISCHRAVIVLS